MRTKIQILIFLIVGVSTNCTKAQQANRQLKDIPKGAKTAVITTAYKAVEHNGKWICGEKEDLEHLDVNTTYYDKYGRKICVIYYGFLGTKEIYYYTPEGKLKKVKCFTGYGIDSLSCIYNSNSQLIEIKGEGYGARLHIEPETRHYDSKGELKGIIREREKFVYDRDSRVQICRKFLGKNNVLAEETTEIINSEGQLEVKIKKYFDKDEEVYETMEILYVYDEKKRLSQTGYEIRNKLGTTLEINEYNKYGDLIHSVVCFRGAVDLLGVNKYEYKNEYEYNQEGKWIKKLEWRRDERLLSTKGEPHIFVREYIEL